jgi:D-alanyl-D-alanine carboxypeptidase
MTLYAASWSDFMRRPLLFVSALFVLSSLANSFATLRADEPNDVEAIIDSVGRQAIEKDKIVGLSIGIAKGDTVLCAKGFGLANVELNVPASAETVYRIGSITKQFTAAAILLLVEDEKIVLDDPLTKYLPDYPKPGSKITVLHLLQHTSGIKSFTSLPAYRKELPLDVTQEEVLKRFQNLPLDFEPGQKHRYCNSGYFLLALIVEKASGKSFQEFVQERLFNTSKLNSTYCETHSRIIPHRAAGYSRWGGVLSNARYINMKQTVGAGDLVSTVGDLLAWQQALVNHRLLKPESFEMMTTRGRLDDGKTMNYGLGLFIRKLGDLEVIRHGGGIQGFRADLAYYPESGYTIAVLSNSGNANASRISDRIARRLLDGDSN